MASLKTDALRACDAALGIHDFKKRRGVYLRSTAASTGDGWLGLNLATWDMPEALHVSPVVGVRYEHLERVLVETAGWSAPLAGVTRPLGYLMPQNSFVQWEFKSGTDLAATAQELAVAVSQYGQPFIDQWSDWQAFSTSIEESGLLAEHVKYYVLPTIRALSGDMPGADRLIRQELDRTGNSTDLYAKSYREFARKFSQAF
ncbi:hypothetical protein JIG36_50755 [Actinoplanes sp. LDG1-06]|uniref:DUF4304 domain-containing protein n=1 Tax=Paractinoplanes ovalisporus TaxID=2810368 RepID=A0ABS2AVD1_9ACTN|nr:hypothetical protein [Actinoplanes ovalisporus]MBM2623799.1 hypothetical protein [Actinoplanes ovalisporus]